MKKNNYIAWMMTLSNGLFLTLGHYLEFWVFCYFVALVVGLMTAIVLNGIK